MTPSFFLILFSLLFSLVTLHSHHEAFRRHQEKAHIPKMPEEFSMELTMYQPDMPDVMTFIWDAKEGRLAVNENYNNSMLNSYVIVDFDDGEWEQAVAFGNYSYCCSAEFPKVRAEGHGPNKLKFWEAGRKLDAQMCGGQWRDSCYSGYPKKTSKKGPKKNNALFTALAICFDEKEDPYMYKYSAEPNCIFLDSGLQTYGNNSRLELVVTGFKAGHQDPSSFELPPAIVEDYDCQENNCFGTNVYGQGDASDYSYDYEEDNDNDVEEESDYEEEEEYEYEDSNSTYTDYNGDNKHNKLASSTDKDTVRLHRAVQHKLFGGQGSSIVA